MKPTAWCIDKSLQIANKDVDGTASNGQIVHIIEITRLGAGARQDGLRGEDGRRLWPGNQPIREGRR
jgi:hypothetical protein